MFGDILGLPHLSNVLRLGHFCTKHMSILFLSNDSEKALEMKGKKGKMKAHREQ